LSSETELKLDVPARRLDAIVSGPGIRVHEQFARKEVRNGKRSLVPVIRALAWAS